MTPTLAAFETATRVRYAGPNRGAGRARAASTVLEAHPHRDDQDDPRPYTVTPDTLHLWTLLAAPRVYATDQCPAVAG
jgi:hypothetical protein